MKLEIISEGRGPQEGHTHRTLKYGDRYFWASRVGKVFGIGNPECLVFPCDSNGNVTDWLEVAGGDHMSLGEATADLQERLNNEG